jgi:hypothetical protein
MKFEDMLTFWKMKQMIKHDSCLTRARIFDSKKRNVLYQMEVRDIPRNGQKHATVTYRFTIENEVKSNFALVYADILFTGFAPAADTDQIFIKNAKVSDLERILVNELSPIGSGMRTQ